MNFATLYNNNRSAVERSLLSMWCTESNNESQLAYVNQLKELIHELFAPENAVPVVQCMNSYVPVASDQIEKAKALVGNLWKFPFAPYAHQYQSWDVLLNQHTLEGKPKSIVVTTGTGSGKTECFMLPLVHDLSLNPVEGQIQALFLYPLNALMEDQKERLEELITVAEKETGIRLTYTVYNGDLPETEPKPTAVNEDAQRLRKSIEQITGGAYTWVTDENGKNGHYELKDSRFPHMVYTREAVRANPPHIVLTNPTMLEYILLRGADTKLMDDKSALRWIVIDETHSYTGAGAAELAMLLRRVLLAFHTNADDVHFATSSATFGNGMDKQKDEQDLKQFIAGITGIKLNQIEVVNGLRIGANEIPKGIDAERWRKLFHSEYVSLNELYPGNSSISEKLQWLDEMCQREEERCKLVGKKIPDMKLKVHYFYRVPNNGLFIRLDEHKDGAFKIYTENVIGKVKGGEPASGELPLLELCRCKHCGEYVALGRANVDSGDYEPITTDDSDMFDLDQEVDDSKSAFTPVIFGLSKSGNTEGDGNVTFSLDAAGKLNPCRLSVEDSSHWHIVGNIQRCCPYCNAKQYRTHNTESDTEIDINGDIEDNRLQKFRVSADFISRKIAPSTLDELEKGQSSGESITLHSGQQYISFVDSRQSAAKATIKQNVEQERLWLYSTIYHELCRRKANGLTKEAAMSKAIAELTQNPTRAVELAQVITDLGSSDERVVRHAIEIMDDKNYMTWGEITDLIRNDPYCEIFASVFVKRSGDSDETENGKPSKEILEKYIQSILVTYLSRRPSSASSPENMGLFESCYPQLKQIVLPEAVKAFNQLLNNPANQITTKDWQDLIHVYLDYTVRSNQSVFLRVPGVDHVDIFATERFSVEKPHRRPFRKPLLSEGSISKARIVRYLCALIVRDDSSLTLGLAQDRYFPQITAVVDAFWEDMTGPKYKILEVGQRLEDGKFVLEKDNAPRFNLYNMSFKLFDDVYLVDTKADANRHLTCLRPISCHFKRYSPFLKGNSPVELDESLHEVWEPYPYYRSSDKKVNVVILEAWARIHRSLLWENKIWGKDGCFTDRLETIHLFPDLFLQQEHTAQVDKSIARGLQTKFKDHSINILACSTTMEMGVDLGNLEVVMLSSVPPLPANYKQRAGRSGRNNKVRSVCITLCSSDVIGLRTLRNPIEKIISRPVRVPTVDLQSPQVIQRHVNAFLIRSFGVFMGGEKGGNLSQRVADFYTPFHIRINKGKVEIYDDNSTNMDPNFLLGDPKNTKYAQFNQKCAEPLEPSVREELTKLLKGTVYEDQISMVVKYAQEVNDRCYTEIYNKMVDLKNAYAGSSFHKLNYLVKLKIQYIDILYNRLLNFWATSRFTPNANMPVNVLSLDLNSNGKRDFFSSLTSSNPSYSLREAIAQYAPGNSVAVDGVVYTVRGIQVTNMYDYHHKAYKTIYRNSDKTVIDDSTLSNQIKWAVNDNYGVELIQPSVFLPDMNEDKSRLMENASFNHVNAQLIDADDWSNTVTEPHLYSVRPNSESGNAKILYYNEGGGFGYCYCPSCGRTVLEEGVSDKDDPHLLPSDFNPRQHKKEKDKPPRPNFHFAISGKDYRSYCSCSNNFDLIRRNMIIGDLIQTDYCEIRIRHKGMNRWLSNRDEEGNLLVTLGIAFTQTLVDILGKERGAVDFTLMPNGHICVFDCNPGGAGYANQMANLPVMKEVIKATKQLLLDAKSNQSKDMLLDKFTLRFARFVDIDAALAWIAEEEEVGDTIPQNIKDAFPGSSPSQTTLYDLKKAFATSYHKSVIFADNVYAEWDYDNKEQGWQPQNMRDFVIKGQTTSFCILGSSDELPTEPIRSICRELAAWTKGDVVRMANNPLSKHGLYPIAYVDGNLYFMNCQENAQLNIQWGNNTMFFVRAENPAVAATPLDLSYKANAKLIKLEGAEFKQIYSKELGKILQDKSDGLFAQFIQYAKQKGTPIRVSYQDEHLKSIMGIILTLQTMEVVLEQIGADFEIEFKVESYRDDKGNADKISTNQPTSVMRDSWLTSQTKLWLEQLCRGKRFSGRLVPVVSLPKRTLTHWRVLTFECGGKRLSIYPDGGFINEWNIGKQPDGSFYDVSDITPDANVFLFRNKDIKFDIIIEDC